MMLLSQLVTLGTVAAAMSWVVSALLVYSQGWHGKLSHDHDLDGVQKVHTTAVPRVGGLAVVVGIIVALTLVRRLWPAMFEATPIDKAIMLLWAGMPAFLAGAVEDVTKRVSVRVRLAATICSALLASALLGATVSELDIWGVDHLLAITPIAIAVTAIVVAGGANAINIIDGFNGLSGGVTLVMLAALGAIAAQVGDGFVCMLAALGAGAVFGFLWMNFPRGGLFLGDGGAYFLGFWCAESAVLLVSRNPSVSAWQVLALHAYPVTEDLYSIFRKKVLRGMRVTMPDRLHLHMLIYRRCGRRNAGVAALVAPWTAAWTLAVVALGGSGPAAALLLAVHAAVYVAVYVRLLRGGRRLHAGAVVKRLMRAARAPRPSRVGR
jgi:UDP-N-acetylmuramyl pentapeptide phosphotransferase/UDP-N-acetylglucosamine-1-phosphate transferase